MDAGVELVGLARRVGDDLVDVLQRGGIAGVAQAQPDARSTPPGLTVRV